MMRLSSSLGFCLTLVGALAVGACSSSNGNPVDSGTDTATPTDSSTAINVTVSGTAAPHPLTTPVGMNPATDFSEMLVAVVDPAVVIANPLAPPLQGGPLNTTAGNCTAAGCAWSFDNVDISKISLGLVGIVDDMRTTNKVWLKTGTGAGAASFIAMTKTTKAPITDRRLFAVSKNTEAALAMFAAAVLQDSSIVPGSLEARGFMLATVVDKVSAGATPVAGAMITPLNDTRTNVIYPNATFTGVSSTGTAAHGTVLVVPKMAADAGTPTSIVASWMVTPPSGDTRTWANLTAGTSPGTAFVLLFAANE